MIRVAVIATTEALLSELVAQFAAERDLHAYPLADARKTVSPADADVVLAGVDHPDSSIIALLRRQMATDPIPIVALCVGDDATRAEARHVAKSVGAVAVVDRIPENGAPAPLASLALVDTVRIMAEVKVVRRRDTSTRESDATDAAAKVPVSARPAIVAIGASTGGPQALRTVIGSLPPDFALPILVVQHISNGFHTGLVEWLAGSTGRTATQAVHGEMPRPGHVHIAPADMHLGVLSDGRLGLSNSEPENGVRPAVSFMFRSVAEVYGARAIGVLLTGMGRDGSSELALLREKGAVTIAQDEHTSIVFGMPAEAVKLGGASFVLPLERIGPTIAGIAARGSRSSTTGDSR